MLSHRSVLQLLLITFVIFMLSLGGCGNGAPQLGMAEPWPEADALFRSDPRWLGGESAISVPLDASRSLWLFGSSFIDEGMTGSRASATVVHNTVAIQDGLNPSTATIDFHWDDTGPVPGPFFPGAGETWLWPNGGLRVGGTLILFYSRLRPLPGVDLFPFEIVESVALRIANPDDAPADWVVDEPQLPALPLFKGDLGHGIFERDGYVHAYATAATTYHEAYAMRWTRADFEAADLTAGQWWTGDTEGWVDAGLGTLPAPVLIEVGPAFSMTRDPTRGRIVHTQSLGYRGGFAATRIGLRFGQRLEGPFGDPFWIYEPPEASIPGVFINSARGHPQLVGAELVATYVANTFDPQQVVDDPSLYYPRFVRLTLSAAP